MRSLVALLVVLTLPASAQSRSQESPTPRDRLVADLDRAMQTSDEHRVTQRGDRIVFRRQSGESCTVTVPVTPATEVEAVGANLLSYQVAGIRWEDCANSQTTERVRFFFRQQGERDLALQAARALIDGWNRRATPLATDQPRQPDVVPRSPTDQRFGEAVSGTLSAGDRFWDDGRRFDPHRIRVPGGDRLVVDLRSSSFDTYLYVESPSGEKASNDDWGGSTAHSRVEIDDPAQGTWTFTVSSYGAGETGAYTLDLRTDRDRPAPPAPDPVPADDPDLVDRALGDRELTVALNQLIAAAPSFDGIKGQQLQSNPPGYDSRVSLPNASQAYVQCPPSGCEATVVMSSFAADDRESAGNAYAAMSVMLGLLTSGTALEGAPYRHEPRAAPNFPLSDDYVASNGLRLQARLVDTLNTSPGAMRYYVLLQIVP